MGCDRRKGPYDLYIETRLICQSNYGYSPHHNVELLVTIRNITKIYRLLVFRDLDHKLHLTRITSVSAYRSCSSCISRLGYSRGCGMSRARVYPDADVAEESSTLLRHLTPQWTWLRLV
jgi:hypothetical protein